LQSPHFDWLLSAFQIRGVIRYSPAVVPLAPDQLSEAEILAHLTAIAATGGDSPEVVAAVGARLVDGILARSTTLPGSPVHGRDPAELRAQVHGDTDLERHLDVLLRLGPYGDGFGANPGGLTLQQLREHPEGVDFGPLVPRLPEVIAHADGRIALCPETLHEQGKRLVEELAARTPRDEDLVLIGRRALRSNNSWMHNLPNLVGGSNRCTLQLSPLDASRLGIADGDKVRVRSAVGEVVVAAEHSDAIRPGVVSLPHGWGHDVPDVAMQVARSVGGVNCNALTDDSVLDALSGNAVFNGVPVIVEPA
jgi:anaerobic selenocysteine-containing dehydrogenase